MADPDPTSRRAIVLRMIKINYDDYVEEKAIICRCGYVAQFCENKHRRRFYACKHRRSNGCGFFKWEEEVDEMTMEVINQTGPEKDNDVRALHGMIEDVIDDSVDIWNEHRKTIRIGWCSVALNLLLCAIFVKSRFKP